MPAQPVSLPSRVAGRSRPSVAKIVFVVMAAVAVGVLVFTGVTTYTVLQTFERVERIAVAFPEEWNRPAATTGAAAASMNFLLLGSDSRGARTGGVADIAGQHSDTLVVVHVPADRGRVTVMSIPRDTWLDVPGHGEAKVNAATAWGGVPLAVQTVETLIGTRIDHVAVVDFAGFQGITDAVGGVDIDNPIAFDSHYLDGHRFAEGTQHLNGTEALAFARERNAFVDSDVQRVRNQQLLIGALFNGVLQQSTLTDPVQLGGVVGAVTEHLAVDETLAASDLIGLGLEMRDVRADDVTYFTLPTSGTGTAADGQFIVNLDRSALPAVQDGFRTDTLDDVPAVQAQNG